MALSRNVIQIAQTSRSQGAKPIIAAIGQAGPIDWRRRLAGVDDGLYTRIHDANQELRSAAQRSGVDWLDLNLVFGAPEESPLPRDLAVDTLHWDEKAYQKLSGDLIRQLDP